MSKKYCILPKCRHRIYNRNHPQDEAVICRGYKPFPKVAENRREWLRLCKLSPTKYKPSHYLCSCHFECCDEQPSSHHDHFPTRYTPEKEPHRVSPLRRVYQSKKRALRRLPLQSIQNQQPSSLPSSSWQALSSSVGQTGFSSENAMDESFDEPVNDQHDANKAAVAVHTATEESVDLESSALTMDEAQGMSSSPVHGETMAIGSSDSTKWTMVVLSDGTRLVPGHAPHIVGKLSDGSLQSSTHLERKLQHLQKENASLRAKIAEGRPCSQDATLFVDDERTAVVRFEHLNDAQIQVMTSLPRSFVVNCALAIREGEEEASIAGTKPLGVMSKSTLNVENQVLMTLSKLRRNQPFREMAIYWGLSDTTLREMFNNMVVILHGLLYLGVMEKYGIPTVEENAGLLGDLYDGMQNCRVIIDCTDFKIHSPSDVVLNRLCYSSYRGMTSFKILLGVSPTGLACSVSLPYPGRTSDDQIVEDSKFSDQLDVGDQVLADKGFRGNPGFTSGIDVVNPTFLTARKQLDKADFLSSKAIARARVLVERVNHRLKLFTILNNIPHQYRAKANMLMQLCAALVNYQAPLFKDLPARMAASTEGV